MRADREPYVYPAGRDEPCWMLGYEPGQTGSASQEENKELSKHARRPVRGSLAMRRTIAATAKAVKSLVRLTPAGDAARSWAPIAVTLLLVFTLAATSGLFGEVQMLLILNVFYGVFLALTWSVMYSASPEDARLWALAQEVGGSRLQRLVAVGSGKRVFSGGTGMFMIISFSALGVSFALLLLPQSGGSGSEAVQTFLCALGVATSWALLNTSYAMYYTHLYYRDEEAPGGLYFPGGENPGTMDFAYFAFTLGTAFATSDVQITSSEVRRVALFHGVLAFFYNTAILALVINLVFSSF